MSPKLPPHPEPPSDPSRLTLPIVEVSREWWRSHGATEGVVFFGKSGDHRFDSPGGEYGIMYVGEDSTAAFVETYLRNPSGFPPIVTMASLVARYFTQVLFGAPLRLVDLTGPGLSQMGTENRLTSGDTDLSQRWALAFFNHPYKPDGILYRSRHDPSKICCGVFDRCGGAKPGRSLGSLADPGNASILGPILDRYKVALLP